MPPGIEDRAADCWEALLAIADAAGGDWPARARAAALELVAQARDADSASLGVRLLGDLRHIFGDQDAMFTKAIIERGRPENRPGATSGQAAQRSAARSASRPYGAANRCASVGDEQRVFARARRP
jgi:hypothetical protein